LRHTIAAAVFVFLQDAGDGKSVVNRDCFGVLTIVRELLFFGSHADGCSADSHSGGLQMY
jgi:hypothetical protein